MRQTTCYYDGACGLCQRSSKILKKLDWANRLRFVDLTSFEPDDLPVPLDEALQGMPVERPDGKVLVGFEGVRHAMSRTPPGWPAAMIMALPGLRSLANRAYNAIARRRSRRHVCKPGAGHPPSDDLPSNTSP